MNPLSDAINQVFFADNLILRTPAIFVSTGSEVLTRCYDGAHIISLGRSVQDVFEEKKLDYCDPF